MKKYLYFLYDNIFLFLVFQTSFSFVLIYSCCLQT